MRERPLPPLRTRGTVDDEDDAVLAVKQDNGYRAPRGELTLAVPAVSCKRVQSDGADEAPACSLSTLERRRLHGSRVLTMLALLAALIGRGRVAVASVGG